MRISDWSSDVCSSDLGDLADPAEQAVEQKQRVRRRQRIAADPVNRPEVDESKGAGIEEAHIAGATGRQATLQVLLERRAQVLHEGGENGNRNPELEHGDRKSVV